MPLKSDFNQPPYYDDYSDQKNFHRILFKPAVAVQARELLQLQTILQNQIERFGNNVLKEGTIISGGNFTEETPLPFVKIRDIAFDSNNLEVATDNNQYVGLKAVGEVTGISAFIIDTRFGLETQTPDLATLFVRYTNSTTSEGSNVSTFSPTEIIQLYAENVNTGVYDIPIHRVTAAGIIDADSIGNGYGVRCGDGIIFQKGNFIRFEDSLTIVAKYNTLPNGVLVGFETIEQIIDSNEDSSLLDPAGGFYNADAPGADRIQLTPRLVVRTLAQAENDENFFALQEYENGTVVRRNLSTQYNSILEVMETRTSDESGDYVVNPFKIRTGESVTSGVNIIISPGLAYVNGKRIQTLGDIKVPIEKASTFSSVDNQNIVANFGSYYVVSATSSSLGLFNFEGIETVNFKNSSDVTVGTAQIRAVTNHTVTGQFRLYVFNVKSSGTNSISNSATKIVSAGSGSGTATIILQSSKAKLHEGQNNSSVFPLGIGSIKSVDESNTDYIFRKTFAQSADTSGNIIVNTNGTDLFPYQDGTLNADQIHDILVVSTQAVGSYVVGGVISIDSATISNGSSTLTIVFTPAPASVMTVTVNVNLKTSADGLSINRKTLETAYVKVNCNNNSGGITGNYCLGLPDVFKIKNVWRNSNSSFVSIKADANKVNNSFKLIDGQWENQYRLSSVQKQRGAIFTTGDRLLFELDVFKKDTGDGSFFTVNSYPVEDSLVTLPTGQIRTEDIPIASGLRLRDCIDTRPRPANTANYEANSASANVTTNPSNVHDFSGAGARQPAPGATIETSYEYYQGRVDKLIVDEFGDFQIIEGTPDDAPISPNVPEKSMTVATLKVPPFPTLASRTANESGKSDYGVTYSTYQNRRYTMKDIGDIDKRIENLEYYTALSALETSARDLTITDGEGLNKFKNGIFVDNFTNLLLGDVHDDDFSASIDPARAVIQPRIRQYPIDLKYLASSLNVSRRTDLTGMSYGSEVLIDQVNATTTKSCATNFWNYNGNMQIAPEFDTGPDTNIAPDISFDFDFASPLIEFTKALAEFVPLQQTSRDIQSSTASSTSSSRRGRRTTQTTLTTTTNRITDTLRKIEVGTGARQTQDLGDFVTDVSFSPYMRSQQIQIFSSGMRPNTRHYFYFDGESISSFVSSGTEIPEGGSARDRVIRANGLVGGSIISDSSGVVRAIFRLPENKFFVGDSTLEIMDRPNYSEKDQSTSSASKTYTAFNFSSTRAGASASTRPPEVSLSLATNSSVNTQSTIRRSVRVEPSRSPGGPGGGNGGRDPIAQTFIIDPEKSGNDNSIHLDKLDLFFSSRSRENNGVTVQIREVENGYPAGIIVPFSNVHLNRNQVSVNSSSALTETTVVFSDPVVLRVGREYAIVIKPDGNDPDYRVWISKTGQIDVDKGVAINQDTNSGTLFTSTNNRAWTPYQDENLKFKLHRLKYTTGTGTMTMTNRDHEFFTIGSVSGAFEKTENIFRQAPAQTGSVSITSGSSTISGTGTTFTSDYQQGQYIVVEHATDRYEVLEISQIPSDVSLIVKDVALATGSTGTHYKSPAGKLEWLTSKTPSMLMLKDSSARLDLKFEAGDVLIGADSSAQATLITVDDLPISYIEPKIYRSNFNRTDTKLSIGKLWDGSSDANSRNLQFNKSNFLYDKPYYIRSKSNSPTSQTFNLVVNMSAEVEHTSPLIDHQICTMMTYQYLVNNSSEGEGGSGGDADSKYISKVISLADGQDSEDIRIFIDAYRPPNTDIIVYAKFKAEEDNRDIKDVEWTELNKVDSSDVYSSAVNREDYREFGYLLKTAAPSPVNGGGAYFNSTNENIVYRDGSGNEFTDFKQFAIKIAILAPNHSSTPQLKNLRVIAVS